MMKDRLVEFRQARVSFQKIHAKKGARQLSDGSSHDGTQPSFTSAFLQKVEAALATVFNLEQELTALQHVHLASTLSRSSAVKEEPGMVLAKFALSTTTNLIPVVTEAHQHHVAMQYIERLCHTARHQFQEIRRFAKNCHTQALTDTEIRIIKQQYQGLQEKLQTLLTDYRKTQLLFPQSQHRTEDPQDAVEAARSTQIHDSKKEILHRQTSLSRNVNAEFTDTDTSNESGHGGQLRDVAEVENIQEAKVLLSTAEMQLRDLRKIEEEMGNIRTLFDDLAFYVDSQGQFLDIVEVDVAEASATIVLVTEDLSDRATKKSRARRIRITCSMLNTLIILIVFITAALLYQLRLPFTSSVVVPLMSVLLLAVIAITGSVLYTEKILWCFSRDFLC